MPTNSPAEVGGQGDPHLELLNGLADRMNNSGEVLYKGFRTAAFILAVGAGVGLVLGKPEVAAISAVTAGSLEAFQRFGKRICDQVTDEVHRAS